MALSIGIVGLPNVGKSTLFKAVTNKQVDIQNYPFTTIEPNVGVVAVPDERVDALHLFSSSRKKIFTTIEFIDIAGLVKGAAQGEGLGNKFLSNIREVDAIAQVVRGFEDKNITHVHNRIDPADDIAIINTELIMADLEIVQKRTATSDKKAHTPGPDSKNALAELTTLTKFKNALEAGGLLIKLELSEDEHKLAKELNLLTSKPLIYVINVSEKQLTEGYKPYEKLLSAFDGSDYVIMCNKLELDLSDVSVEEKKELLAEFNLPESGLDKLIKTSYHTLGLITFLTTGEDESRAWTAHRGELIPKASRAIHTDFERLFIRAEVINWKTLIESGSHANARAHGSIHTVGKDYVVKDGDVVEILIGK